jgi:hypothetical protein
MYQFTSSLLQVSGTHTPMAIRSGIVRLAIGYKSILFKIGHCQNSHSIISVQLYTVEKAIISVLQCLELVFFRRLNMY